MQEWTYSWVCGEYPGLLCPLVSRWSSVPLRSSCVVPCNRPVGLPLISPWGLAPIIPDALFIKPGLPSNGKEVSANAAYERKRERGNSYTQAFSSCFSRRHVTAHGFQLVQDYLLFFYWVTSELLLKNQYRRMIKTEENCQEKKKVRESSEVAKTISSPYKTGLKWTANKESTSIHMIMKPSKTLPQNS